MNGSSAAAEEGGPGRKRPAREEDGQLGGQEGGSEGANPGSSKRVKVDAEAPANGRPHAVLTERDVGIEEYVDAAARPAFHAIIKQRFTDFQVFEVDQHGVIQHITDLGPPKNQPPSALEQRIERERRRADPPASAEGSESKDVDATPEEKRPSWEELDASLIANLSSYFDEDSVARLQDMWTTGFQPENEGESPARDSRSATSKPLPDKADRTAAHALIRQLFRGYFQSEADSKYHAKTTESSTDAEKVPAPKAPAIIVRWTPTGKAEAARDSLNRGPRAPPAHDPHPPFLHFLLQKTNRDSQEALGLLSQALGLSTGSGGRFHNGRGGRGGRGGHGGRRGAEAGSSQDLAVAGTKDRRSVSIQRVTLFRRRMTAEQVWAKANGCDVDFDSDLSPSFSSDRGGRGRGGGGRGRGRGGRGGRGGGNSGFHNDYDEPRSYLDAFKQRGAKGLRIAHLKYADAPLRLGDLSGNEFLITLRNVKLVDEVSGLRDANEVNFDREEAIIAQAMQVLRDRGFLNYYGMQRFGTSNISTHKFGIPLFQSDYERVVRMLLEPRAGPAQEPGSTPSDFDAAVIKARELYAAGELQAAFDTCPKGLVAERTVLSRLVREEERHGWNKLPVQDRKNIKRDWRAAFGAIPKTLRMMYVHAYQSYLWNKVVSERVRRFGLDRPVVGDYVFADPRSKDEAEDADGEGGGDVALGGEDDDAAANAGAADDAVANAGSSTVPGAKPKVKVLTAADVDQYHISDVVMPLPGSEITFEPGSWLADLYNDLLAQDGLKPEDLGSSDQPEYALRGAYRKMIHVPKSLSYQLIRYTDPTVDLALSDEARLLGHPEPPGTSSSSSSSDAGAAGAAAPAQGRFLALQIRLVLGTSAYATMALREVLKTETSSAAQRELTLKSEDQAWVGKGAGGGLGGAGGAEGGGKAASIGGRVDMAAQASAS